MSDTRQNRPEQADKRPQINLKILNERLKILERNWVTGPEMRNDTLEKLAALYLKNRFAGALTPKEDLWLDVILKDLVKNPLIKKIKSIEEENESLMLQLKLIKEATEIAAGRQVIGGAIGTIAAAGSAPTQRQGAR